MAEEEYELTVRVALPANRDFEGVVSAETQDGKVLAGPFRIAARAADDIAAAHGNPTRATTLPFGDPPLGVYCVQGISPTGEGTRYRQDLFGSHDVLILNGVGGHAALADANGRFEILIHGGSLGADGHLRMSSGHFRLQDSDLAVLVDLVRRSRKARCVCEPIPGEAVPIVTDGESSGLPANAARSRRRARNLPAPRPAVAWDCLVTFGEYSADDATSLNSPMGPPDQKGTAVGNLSDSTQLSIAQSVSSTVDPYTDLQPPLNPLLFDPYPGGPAAFYPWGRPVNAFNGSVSAPSGSTSSRAADPSAPDVQLSATAQTPSPADSSSYPFGQAALGLESYFPDWNLNSNPFLAFEKTSIFLSIPDAPSIPDTGSMAPISLGITQTVSSDTSNPPTVADIFAAPNPKVIDLFPGPLSPPIAARAQPYTEIGRHIDSYFKGVNESLEGTVGFLAGALKWTFFDSGIDIIDDWTGRNLSLAGWLAGSTFFRDRTEASNRGAQALFRFLKAGPSGALKAFLTPLDQFNAAFDKGQTDLALERLGAWVPTALLALDPLTGAGPIAPEPGLAAADSLAYATSGDAASLPTPYIGDGISIPVQGNPSAPGDLIIVTSTSNSVPPANASDTLGISAEVSEPADIIEPAQVPPGTQVSYGVNLSRRGATPLEAQIRFQQAVDAAGLFLFADGERFKTVLSLREYNAMRTLPYLRDRFIGIAIERYTAEVARSWQLPLEYLSGANNPDFLGLGQWSGYAFDVFTTTEASYWDHFYREYGPLLIPGVYLRPNFIIFPP